MTSQSTTNASKTLKKRWQIKKYAAAITGNHKANKERAQTEREQIDDLSMELELADEDQPVLWVTELCTK